jgi:uncharacterized delta-60 repeat protein
MSAFGQPGANDPTFNPEDVGVWQHGTQEVFDLDLQPDGKIYITGWISSYNGELRTRLARLNPDGSLDESFDPGDVLDYGPRNAVEVQSDGKVLTAGYNDYSVIRLNTDGTIDQGFQTGSTWNWDFTNGGSVYALECQPDGKVLAGGDFSYYNGYVRNGLIRLESNGARDVGFMVPNDCYGIRAIAVQPDGRVLIAGGFIAYGGVSRRKVARLNPDGSLDTSFDPGLGANAIVHSMALLPDGRILLGGEFVSFNGVACNRLIRLDDQGNIDPSFDPALGPNGPVRSVAVQPDGRILIAGTFTTCSGGARRNVARLEADGSLDDSFGQESGADDDVHAIGLQQDGSVLVVGAFNDINGFARHGVCRLRASGAVDEGFCPAPPTGANGSVYDIDVISGDRILVVGVFTEYGRWTRKYVMRLLPDGDTDLSFALSSSFNGSVNQCIGMVGDQVLIRGYFSRYGTTDRRQVALLNSSGELDQEFDPGSRMNGSVYAVAVQNEMVFVAGTFTSYDGVERHKLARVFLNGDLDGSFVPDSLGFQRITGVTVQHDNKVVVTGLVSTSPLRYGIARLLPDGDMDPGFVTCMAIDQFTSILALLPDGKIIATVNTPTNVCGSSWGRLVRLNANGTIDPTFDPGDGPNNAVRRVEVLADGRLVIGGWFTAYDGVGCGRLARVNVDGSLDESFDTGTGANANVLAIAQGSDERLLIGGDFTTYDGVARSRIARVLGQFDLGQAGSMLVFPNPVAVNEGVSIALDTSLMNSYTGPWSVEVVDLTGRIVLRREEVTPTSWMRLNAPGSAGLYHVRVRAAAGQMAVAKFVVE